MRIAVVVGTRPEAIKLAPALDEVFAQHHLDAVLVQGDTTSALAGVLAANTGNTPLVHLEAGLRSFDRAMPEEHHRVLIDHCTPGHDDRSPPSDSPVWPADCARPNRWTTRCCCR